MLMFWISYCGLTNSIVRIARNQLNWGINVKTIIMGKNQNYKNVFLIDITYLLVGCFVLGRNYSDVNCKN